MKTISGALADHLASDTMTTARLWKLKRKATTQVSAVQAYFSGPNPSGAQNQIAEGSGSFSSGGTFGSEESVGTSYPVADLSDNNTSASNSWSTTSSGDAAPADTSKVSIKAALYSGASTRVLAHMVGWFYSGSSHISVGYFDDATQVANAIADMKSRGIDGVILDWYGQGSHSDTVAGYIKTACEADGTMTFAICIDKGTFSGSSNPTSDFEAAVAYVNSAYFGSTAYEKHSSRPLLLEFGCEKLSVDWSAVRTYMSVHGNPLFIWQDLSAPTGTSGTSGGSQDAFAASYTDGVFSWVGVSAAASGDPEALNYLRNFYTKAKSYPAKLAMGSVRKGFNDALASWGTGRVMTQANGSTWVDSLQVVNDNYSSALQLPYVQVVTWDDYEEGTEIETGIATNLAFGTVTASGNSVLWSTTGNLAPFDHIGVYASSDGGVTYAFLGKISKLAASVDLVGAFSLAAGTYKVRLRAVGISSVQSVQSADVTITVSGSGGTATFLDWEFVGGQWRSTAAAHASSELEWLYANDFGFSIPSTATITGASCLLFYNSQSPTGSYIQEVSLFNGSSPIGSEKTPHLNFAPSVQTMNLGGQQDAWGYALTPSFVNSSNFGFGIRPYYDGVRIYITGFALTLYYTLPATSGGRLTQVSTLVAHTNFTGEVQADTSADAISGIAGVVIDDTGIMYAYSSYGASLSLEGHVRMFDTSDGTYLGELGIFPNVGFQGGALAVLNDPTYGKWLLVYGGEIWGQQMQAMAIDATDGASHAVSPGTVSNNITPVYNGISSGGNDGRLDVDPLGGIWIGTTDNGGTYAGVPRIIHVGFTASATLAVISTTSFATLYSWTSITGVQYDPLSGNLTVWGNNGSSNILARVDQTTTAYAILASATSGLSSWSVPANVGADGCYVVPDGTLTGFHKVNLATMAEVQSHTVFDYGLSLSLVAILYDSSHGYVYLIQSNPGGGYAVNVCDLANPASSGTAGLVDPSLASPNQVCYQNAALSPDGNVFVTEFSGTNGVAKGFYDIWGTSFPSAATPAPTLLLGFTDHDVDILYDDGSGDGPVLYVARTGATWSAIESKADFSVDNLEIDSFLESDLITDGDIRGGLYDGAECTIYLVNWADLTQKHLVLRYGVFGSVKVINGLFTTEIRGLAYRLGFTLGGYYQPLCRAELFSTPQNAPNRQWYCNLNAARYQQAGSVASSADSLHIVPAAGLLTKGTVGAGASPPTGYYNFGLIKFTSGNNQNLKFEIESWDGTTLTLYDYNPLPYAAAPGDTFVIEPGCDKLKLTCLEKYNNVVNHRGEAEIPGLDAVLDMFPSA